MNNLAQTGALIGNPGISASAEQSGATVKAEMLSVVNINAGSAAKGADGLYTIVIANGKINANDGIVALHFTGGQWQIVIPTGVSQGSVTIKVPDCSPFSIVRLSSSTGGAGVGKTLSIHDALEQAAIAS